MSDTTDVYVNQLIINELSREKYLELSAAGQLQSNQLYLVDEENLDAASGVISNVGTPVSPTDAANKSYVDTVSSNIVSAFPEIPDNIVINNAGNNTNNLAIGKNTATITDYDNSILIGNSAKGAGIAVGYDTSACTFSIAMGCHAQATSDGSIATGYDAKASGISSIAAGSHAQATGYVSIATGESAKASSEGSIAIGCSALAVSKNTVAIGAYCHGVSTGDVSATTDTPIVIGSNSTEVAAAQIRVTKEGVMTVGGNQVAMQDDIPAIPANIVTNNAGNNTTNLAIGTSAQAAGYYSTATGYGAQAKGSYSIAAGLEARAVNDNTIAIGTHCHSVPGDVSATANTPIVIGSNASAVSAAQIRVTKEGVMSIGGNPVAMQDDIPDNIVINNAGNDTGNLAIGSNTTIATYAGNSILIGNSAKGAGIAIGYDTSAYTFSIAMGCHAQAAGNSSIATGLRAQATGNSSIATGCGAEATGSDSIATGRCATTSGWGSIATGSGAQATDSNAIATGTGAKAISEYSIATGSYAKAQDDYTIAIGAHCHAVSTGDVLATANIPIVIGSNAHAVSAAQIRVTKEGVMSIGGNPVAMQDDIPTIDSNLSTTSTNAVQNKVVATAINNLSSTVSSIVNVGVSYAVVNELPSTTTAKTGTIYLIPDTVTGDDTDATNIYEEYLFVNNKFEKIGTTETDLANYATLDDLATKQDAPTGIVTMYGCGACVGSIASDSWTTAIGYQVSATGACGTTAVGYKAYATARSTAIGSCVVAKNGGTAIGIYSEATGTYSIAAGSCAQAKGYGSIATGVDAQTESYGSIAIGCHAQATCDNSIATGSNAQAKGYESIATGPYAKATGYASIAIGYDAKALSSESIAIGCNAKTNNTDSLAIGTNTQANGVGTIAIGSTNYCTFNPTIADANTPIVIGSGESAVSAAQIRVTKDGVMTVGGKEVGKSMLETWTGTTDSQTGETDLMIGAKQENGVYPRLHARNKDIHGVTGFSNESDKYTGQRYLLDWDLAMSNDTSYLMGATKWTGSRRIGANCDAYTTTFVQPLIPANTGTTNPVLPYALPCFENSPVYWNGHIIWNNSLCACTGKYTAQAKDITIPWHNIGTDVSSIEFIVNNNKTDPAYLHDGLAIGYCAKANLCHAVAIGPGAQATDDGSIAIGNSVSATGQNSTAIGVCAKASNCHSIATGFYAQATGYSSIATGYEAKAPSWYSTATGYRAQATGDSSIATGFYACAKNNYTIAIGASKGWSYSVSASTAVPIVIGSDHSSVSAAQITVTSAGILNVGGNPVAMQDDIPDNIVTNNVGNNTSNLAIGYGAYATGSSSIATGYYAQATGDGSIATGYSAQATACRSIATGYYSIASSSGSIAIGDCARATCDYSIAAGTEAQAAGCRSIATGVGAQATGSWSIATGSSAKAVGDYTVAMGAYCRAVTGDVSATADTPIVIGSNASSVSAAQIKVTNTGIMSIGENPVARKQFVYDIEQSNNTSEITRMVKHHGDIWFAATKSGVYKSTDKAKTWTVTGRTDPTSSIFHVENNTWLAGGFSSDEGKGIHITHDNGDTWTTINTTYCPWSFCRGKLTINNVAYPNAIVASCTQKLGMIYSLDNGETWTGGAGWTDIETGAFDVQYIKDGFVRNNTTYHWIMGGGYVAGNKGGIWYLDEATFTWIQEPIMATDNTNPNLLPCKHKVYSVAVYTTKTGKKRIYWNDSGDLAGTGGIYYIDEDDTTCHKISGLTIYVYNFVENPVNGYLYITAFGGGELLQISDDGNTFVKVATPTVSGVHGYAFDISEDCTYFVMGYDGQGFARAKCPDVVVTSTAVAEYIEEKTKQLITVRKWN